MAAPSATAQVKLQASGAGSQKLEVDASTRAAWDKRYALTVSAASTDEEELQRLDALIGRAAGGYTWTETGDDIEVGTPTWKANDVRAAAGISADAGDGTQGNPAIMFAFLGAFFLMIFGVIFFIFGGFGMFSGGGDTPATEVAAPITTTLPGPNVTVISFTPSPVPPTQAPPVVTIGDADLPLDAPRNIEIRGQAFPILPGTVEDGVMTYTELDGAQAVWFVSPANWLIGLPESWVNSLQTGEVILARMKTGRLLRFVVDKTSTIEPQQIEYLAQGSAGITFFPLPSSSKRITIVSAHYDPSLEQPDALDSTVQVGAPISITPGVTLTVNSVQVDQMPDASFAVTVLGRMQGAYVSAPMLDVSGQLYAATAPLPEGTFKQIFYLPSLGRGQFVLGDKRVDLGELAAPSLTAQIITATMTTRNTIEFQLQVSAQGGQAWTQTNHFVLLLPASTNTPAQTLAPLYAVPAAAMSVSPSQPTSMTIGFARPAPTIKVVRLQLIDQIWEIPLP